MPNAKIDNNFKPTLTGVSSADGETPERAEINPVTKRLLVDATGGMIGGIDYDYLDVQQTSATVETYVFKTGGVSGVTIRTIVITYNDTSKDNIDTVVWS